MTLIGDDYLTIFLSARFAFICGQFFRTLGDFLRQHDAADLLASGYLSKLVFRTH